MIEKEFIGDITKSQYEEAVQLATSQYGDPKRMRRVALMVHNRTTPHINTRVRVSNWDGEIKSEIMQKITLSNSNGERVKKEISTLLPNKAQDILNAYLSFKNLLINHPESELILLAVQHVNLVWRIQIDDHVYELKISHQFGLSDYYTFEIELMNGKDLTHVDQIRSLLSLKDIMDHDSPERGELRSTNVDLHLESMSEGEITKLIEKYL